MDPIDSAGYALVHDYPGGAPALAPRVNMNAGTLANKANPHCEHQFTVREVLAIQALRGITTMIDAEARALGGVFVPLEDYSGTSDVELLDLYAAYHAEIGETAEAIRDSLAGGEVTREAYERVEREFYEDVQAGFAFLARLRALRGDR